jgi:hypothetical protein
MNELTASSLPVGGELGANAIEVALDDVQVDWQERVGEIGIEFVESRGPDDFVLWLRPFAAIHGRIRGAYGRLDARHQGKITRHTSQP